MPISKLYWLDLGSGMRAIVRAECCPGDCIPQITVVDNPIPIALRNCGGDTNYSCEDIDFTNYFEGADIGEVNISFVSKSCSEIGVTGTGANQQVCVGNPSFTGECFIVFDIEGPCNTIQISIPVFVDAVCCLRGRVTFLWEVTENGGDPSFQCMFNQLDGFTITTDLLLIGPDNNCSRFFPSIDLPDGSSCFASWDWDEWAPLTLFVNGTSGNWIVGMPTGWPQIRWTPGGVSRINPNRDICPVDTTNCVTGVQSIDMGPVLTEPPCAACELSLPISSSYILDWANTDFPSPNTKGTLRVDWTVY